MLVDNIHFYLSIVTDVYPWFVPGLLALLAAVFGSFITCAAYRIPKGISMRTPGSYCPQCQTPLKVLDLVPILSYILYRGRCRHCKQPIPSRYVCIEVICVLCSVFSWRIYGETLYSFMLLTLLLILVYMVWSFVESHHKPYKVLLFFLIGVVIFIVNVPFKLPF